MENPTIRSSTAGHARSAPPDVNVPALIKSTLPSEPRPLAATAAGAVSSLAVPGVEIALTRPPILDPWARLNRAADQIFDQVLFRRASATLSADPSRSALAVGIDVMVDGWDGT